MKLLLLVMQEIRVIICDFVVMVEYDLRERSYKCAI